jgi:hypothetical protein
MARRACLLGYVPSLVLLGGVVGLGLAGLLAGWLFWHGRASA